MTGINSTPADCHQNGIAKIKFKLCEKTAKEIVKKAWQNATQKPQHKALKQLDPVPGESLFSNTYLSDYGNDRMPSEL